MISYLDLLQSELEKYETNPIGDDNKFFLIRSILETQKCVINEYSSDEFHFNSAIECIVYFITNHSDLCYSYFDSCELSEHGKNIVEKCTFNIPLIKYEEFTKQFFSILRAVMLKIDGNSLTKCCIDNDIDFPVTYLYFQKIIVGLRAGDWKFLKPDGAICNVLDHIEIKQPEIKPSSGYYEKRMFKNNNTGEQFLQDVWVSKEDAIKWHSSNLLSLEDKKRRHKQISEKMKAQGYPYADSYDEYIRFLVTNQKDMKFGNFTLLASDILNIFIPYPLR
ncbi:MAG: hypothetical protein NTY70_01790 [Burkholderiales bacterium]|nr:hypothetical protein [Burkholderiales bacterium]